jgi:hypothetical protein
MSQDILIALQNVHERMRERMERHPEYCAMLALEKSIASISEILTPSQQPEAAADREIEEAIAETIAAKVAPVTSPPSAPAAPRPPAAPFFPQHRVVGGQAMGMR